MKRVLVVGTGLLGTSLGLALQPDVDVLLDDAAPDHLDTAVARGAGRRWDRATAPDHAVLCVPIDGIATVLEDLQRLDLGCTFSHVASVQSVPLRDAETRGCDLTTLVGGHPMAGKESSGPTAASADLFAGRPWFVCPGPQSSARAVADVELLARAAGAHPVRTSPEEHDRTVALVSHLPQVVASALAARLVGHAASAAHAGPGLVDTTRLAASPVDLWEQVLRANAGGVAPLLRALAADLIAVAEELDAAPPHLETTADLLRRGNAGRALVPTKRGRGDADVVAVQVVLPDRPGQLAALLHAAGQAGINVEDLRVDHAPGRAEGTVALLVAPGARDLLREQLTGAGWRLHDDQHEGATSTSRQARPAR